MALKGNLTEVHERFVFVYDNVLAKDTCQTIINSFEASEEKTIGKTASGISNKKKSTELYIDPNHKKWELIDNLLFEIFGEYSQDYLSHFPWFNPKCQDVGYFVKKYEQGIGYFNAHVDVSLKKNANRFLVFILYLNTVEDGGETEFTNMGVKITPVAGRLLIFPPMWMFPHRGEMPISSHKYTVNTFFVFPD